MKGFNKIAPAFWRVAQPEPLDSGCGDAATAEIVLWSLRSFEPRLKVLSRLLQDSLEIWTLLAARTRSPLGQRNAIPVGQGFDGCREIVAAHLHMEFDGISTLPAAKAVEKSLRRIDAKGGSLLFVEGTKPSVALSGLAQSYVLARDVEDVDRVSHRLDKLGSQMDVAQSHG